MKQNRFSYYFFEGVKSIFSHGFMSFASVGIMVACLIIMGSFTLLSINIHSMIKSLEKDNQMLAYIDDSFTIEEAMALEDSLLQIENVAKVEFIDKDAAWEAYIAQYDDTSLIRELTANTLRHRYMIFVEDLALLSATKQGVKDIEGIAKVEAMDQIANGFVIVRNVVTGISLVIVGLLLVVSLFIMSNTVKLTTFSRREEIAIMKMVGATDGFIRWPFVFEGMLLGLTGSLLAYLAQWSIYSFITKNLMSNLTFSDLNLAIISFGALSVPMLFIFMVVGLLVGVGGSLLTIKNYLRV